MATGNTTLIATTCALKYHLALWLGTLMNRQRPVILIFLIAYIFLPTVFEWITAADRAWYRPFIIWLAVVIVAFFLQSRRPENDL